MKLQEALKDDIFNLPIERTNYFPSHLETIYSRYIDLLSSVKGKYADAVKLHLTEISSTCTNILEISKLILDGRSIQAYKKLDDLFNQIEDFLVPPASKNVIVPNNHFFYFKARESDGTHFKRDDMFHVPFEKRYSVQTNRFSVPGLPCIYLANSAYTCWEELGRPQLSKLYVSAFKEHRVNLKFLDLTPTAIELTKWHLSMKGTKAKRFRSEIFIENHLKRSLLLHPLLIACYTRVQDPNATFKPEYILPQLLMQWVVTHDHLHGIEYLSTRSLAVTKPTYGNMEKAINYALPVRNVSETGYCKTLTSYLKLTEPLSWELLNIKKPNFLNDITTSTKTYDYNRYEIQLDASGAIPYWESAFGYIEKELRCMELLPLSST